MNVKYRSYLAGIAIIVFSCQVNAGESSLSKTVKGGMHEEKADATEFNKLLPADGKVHDYDATVSAGKEMKKATVTPVDSEMRWKAPTSYSDITQAIFNGDITVNTAKDEGYFSKFNGKMKAKGGGSGGAGDLTWSFFGKLSTPKVDLDVDSNNDGTIESDDDNEDKFEEDSPGAVVCIDKKGIAKDLDHLIPLKIRALPDAIDEGTLTLEVSSGSDKIKIWEDASKTNEVSLPKEYNIETDTVPETLYIDGIKKGDAIIDLVYKTKDGTEVGRDKVSVHVADTISFSPAGGGISSIVYSWEPVSYSTGPGAPSDALDAVLDNIKDHGWDVTFCRYTDTTDDDDPGECTLGKFQGMADSGIVVLFTHGTPDPSICAHYFTTEQAANDWVGSTPVDEMEVVKSSSYSPPKPGQTQDHWFIFTTKKWFENNWKSTRDDNKGITIFLSCHGAEDGMVTSAGGRVQLGFEGSHTSGEMASDMEKFFKRLNGSVDNGKKRTAGKAYNDPGAGYHTYFKMFGNDWTTLNPSPLLTAKTGIHDNKAAGLIVFDTFMYSGITADNAVVFTTGTGSARRWFGFTDHKYGISFDFSATPTANAKAILCVNEEFSGGRRLSGDKKTYGSDKSW